MQPILILAIVAIAAIGLGTGFLNNDITLFIQQFGVGEGDIESPIDNAQVDFNIAQLPIPNTEFFKNVINICYVTIPEQVGVLDEDDVLKDSELTCKLTGITGDIIAEGTITADFFAAGKHEIPVIPTPDVRDVHDVIVIAHANTYSQAPPPP